MVLIPQDVIASIIDQIHEVPIQQHFGLPSILLGLERATIRACSTVSRAFLHPSQKLLFSNILIRRYLGDPYDYGSKLCRRFHSLLVSSPHISCYVHHLIIVDASVTWRPPTAVENESWILSEPTLPPVLRMLPNLRSLHVNPVNNAVPFSWDTFPADLKSSFIHLLRTPSLTRVEFRALNVTSAIFLYAPQLTHLRFSHALLDRSPDIQQLSLQYPQWPSSVKKVTLTYLAIVAGNIWIGESAALCSIFDIPRLRQLSVVGLNTEFLGIAARIIKEASSSLESLQLILHDPEDYGLLDTSAYSVPINLPTLLKLRFLELSVNMWSRTDGGPFPWLLRLLEDLGSSSHSHACLESLIFGVSTEQFSDADLKLILEHQLWDTLDETLTGKAFSNIRNVTIFISYTYTIEGVVAQWITRMTERLPLLEAKRALVITGRPQPPGLIYTLIYL